MSECRRDSGGGADWMQCARGTVGCPVIHDGLTPHCIACTAGAGCRFAHDPPGLEQTLEDYLREHPEERERLSPERPAPSAPPSPG